MSESNSTGGSITTNPWLKGSTEQRVPFWYVFYTMLFAAIVLCLYVLYLICSLPQKHERKRRQRELERGARSGMSDEEKKSTPPKTIKAWQKENADTGRKAGRQQKQLRNVRGQRAQSSHAIKLEEQATQMALQVSRMPILLQRPAPPLQLPQTILAQPQLEEEHKPQQQHYSRQQDDLNAATPSPGNGSSTPTACSTIPSPMFSTTSADIESSQKERLSNAALLPATSSPLPSDTVHRQLPSPPSFINDVPMALHQSSEGGIVAAGSATSLTTQITFVKIEPRNMRSSSQPLSLPTALSMKEMVAPISSGTPTHGSADTPVSGGISSPVEPSSGPLSSLRGNLSDELTSFDILVANIVCGCIVWAGCCAIQCFLSSLSGEFAYGDMACAAESYLHSVGIFSIFGSLPLLAWRSYVAVVLRGSMEVRTALVLCTLIWLASNVITITVGGLASKYLLWPSGIYCLYGTDQPIWYAVLFPCCILVGLVISVLYFKIWKAVKQLEINFKQIGLQVTNRNTQKEAVVIAVKLSVFVGMYLICWIPAMIYISASFIVGYPIKMWDGPAAVCASFYALWVPIYYILSNEKIKRKTMCYTCFNRKNKIEAEASSKKSDRGVSSGNIPPPLPTAPSIDQTIGIVLQPQIQEATK